jgi:hypothetical protein
MKLIPNERKILERMAPGVLCREGFLGPDSRSLQEILDTDRAAVDRLGVTHEQLAACLRGVCQAGMAALGAEVPVEGGRLRAVYHEAMGYIPSPWGDGATFPKGEVELSDAQGAVRLRFTPLSVHLIERHGFYQGRGSRYRLEPVEVARLFRLDGGPDRRNNPLPA